MSATALMLRKVRIRVTPLLLAAGKCGFTTLNLNLKLTHIKSLF